MLPSGEGTIVATGSIPLWAKRLHGQRLAIRANGRLLGRFPVPVGDFELRIPTPPELHGKPLRLQIAASRFLRPSPLRGDRRRLAFLLREIRWL